VHIPKLLLTSPDIAWLLAELLVEDLQGVVGGIYIYLQWDFCLNVYATPSSASSNFSTSGRHRFGGGTGMAEVGMVIEERRNDEHR